MVRTIRLLVTFALLVVMLFNAHWSVVLSLALISVTIEAIVYSLEKHQEYRKERARAEWNILNKVKKLGRRLDNINKTP